MANNYRHASFVIPNLTPEEAKFITDWIAAIEDVYDDDTDNTAEPLGFDCQIVRDTTMKPCLLITDDGTWCNVVRAADLCQAFLKAHRPDQCIGFDYADTCGTPRVGEFGGGAVFVTAKRATFMHTSLWLERKEDIFRKRSV